MSLLSCPREMQLYHTESLHPPGHPVTAEVLRVKQRPLSSHCQRHEGTQGETITSAQERVVSFTPRPLYPLTERARRYQFNKRLGGPQAPFGRFRDEKNLLLVPGIESRIVQPVAW